MIRHDGLRKGAAAALRLAAAAAVWSVAVSAQAGPAHRFDFAGIDGTPLSLADWSGKPVLVVNTASFCGFTSQYGALQELWERYRDRGLVVLGVPSNDFGGQEPHDEAAIETFCEVNYAVDFPMTAKQRVVGADAHPLYRWIADELGEAGVPKWNFHKYLIDGEGALAGVWPSRVGPLSGDVVAAVESHLYRHGYCSTGHMIRQPFP